MQAAALPSWQLHNTSCSYNDKHVIVNFEDAVENSMLLKRSLVGRIGGPGGKKMEADRLSAWVNKKWRIPGGVEVKEIDEERFLLIFPSKQLAEKMREEKLLIEGQPLWLDFWHSWSCCARRGWNHRKDVWIKVVGLPIFLWNESVLRNIGNFCGGFIEYEPGLFSNSSYKWARIHVKGDDRQIPAHVKIIVGQSMYDCPIWVERKTWVDWVDSDFHVGPVRPPEGKKKVVRGTTASALNVQKLGKQKDRLSFHNGHRKTKSPPKITGQVQWKRVREIPK